MSLWPLRIALFCNSAIRIASAKDIGCANQAGAAMAVFVSAARIELQKTKTSAARLVPQTGGMGRQRRGKPRKRAKTARQKKSICVIALRTSKTGAQAQAQWG